MSRSLLRAGATGALTVGLALAAPSYAGSYKHLDAKSDLQQSTDTCDNNNTTNPCTSTTPVADPSHSEGDIRAVRASYRDTRLDLYVRLVKWAPEGKDTTAPPATTNRTGRASRSVTTGRSGLASVLDRAVAVAASGMSDLRALVVAIKAPHRTGQAFMIAEHLASGRVSTSGADLKGRTCKGVRGSLDRSTLTMHLSMPRACFADAGKVKFFAASVDDQTTNDSTTNVSTDTTWVDDGLSPTFNQRGPVFSPWVHHN